MISLRARPTAGDWKKRGGKGREVHNEGGPWSTRVANVTSHRKAQIRVRQPSKGKKKGRGGGEEKRRTAVLALGDRYFALCQRRHQKNPWREKKKKKGGRGREACLEESYLPLSLLYVRVL